MRSQGTLVPGSHLVAPVHRWPGPAAPSPTMHILRELENDPVRVLRTNPIGGLIKFNFLIGYALK